MAYSGNSAKIQARNATIIRPMWPRTTREMLIESGALIVGHDGEEVETFEPLGDMGSMAFDDGDWPSAAEADEIIARLRTPADGVLPMREMGYTRDGFGGLGGNGRALETPSIEEGFRAEIFRQLNYAPDDVIADGEIHRFGPDDDGKTPGWYVLNADDPAPFGFFGDWRLGSEPFRWCGEQTRPLTDTERAARDKRRAERNNEEVKRQRAAARKAEKIFERGYKPEADFPYLVKKNVGAHDIIQPEQFRIAVPVCEGGEKLVSLQFISDSGEKIFLENGKTKGYWHAIGLRNAPSPITKIVICEGYATGATIYETTGLPVMIAFNAGNLEAVAKQIAAKYPSAMIIIAGDDDKKTELKMGTNSGVECAKKAASAVNGVVALPPFDRAKDGDAPSDWNDFAALRGKGAIAEIFRKAVEAAKIESPPDQPESHDAEAADAPLPLCDTRRPERWPDVDKGGVPRATLRNTKQALRRLGLEFSFDAFCHRKHVSGHTLQEYSGDLTDDICAALRNLVLVTFWFDPGANHTRDALNILCLERRHHPVRDYLDALKWDRKPRIGRWLTTYLGAENTKLNRAIGRIVLTAAVRRVRQPGCKFDTILVLEGKQGSGRSSALAILAGEKYFSDNDILALDAKAQMEALEGIWIYELGELSGLSRADTERVKAFASRQTDRARPAYARLREDRPRQGIFVGTTNDESYLRDRTGNRRWWPVKCGKIELEALRADRDQLWAEAAYLEAEGRSIFLPEGLWADAEAVQDARLESEPWEEILVELGTQSPSQDLTPVVRIEGELRIKSKDLLGSVLGIPAERQKDFHSKRLSLLMRKLGWEGPKVMKFGRDDVARGYRKPDPAKS